MDRLEKWYKDNRAEMDQLEVRPETWDVLAERLPQAQAVNWWAKPWVKWSGLSVLLIGLTILIYQGAQPPAKPVDMVDQRIPADISLMSPEGNKIALSSLSQ